MSLNITELFGVIDNYNVVKLLMCVIIFLQKAKTKLYAIHLEPTIPTDYFVKTMLYALFTISFPWQIYKSLHSTVASSSKPSGNENEMYIIMGNGHTLR